VNSGDVPPYADSEIVMKPQISRTVLYEAAVKGRRDFRSAYRRELEKVRKLRVALDLIRSKGICAGAAFALRKEDGQQRCIEVLNIIDTALKETE